MNDPRKKTTKPPREPDRPPSVDQERLDDIAEKFSTAMRAGQSPSVSQYVDQHGDADGELQQLLTSIQMIEELKIGHAEAEPPGVTPMIERIDDYRFLHEIGRGGMGIVYAAIHESLQRRVAIKILSSGLLGDPKHLARFRREARAAAQLRHTNIVPVFGVGRHEDHHYYVMDHISGITLRQWISRASGGLTEQVATMALATMAMHAGDTENVLPDATPAESAGELALADDPNSQTQPSTTPDSSAHFRWVSEIAMKIAGALQYAHNQGTMHRDIKPGNLILDRKGEIWITDFGLAKLTEQQAVTQTGEIVGTPQYMAPECFEGHFDTRSETYAVGLTLYELLTLQPAVSGKSPSEVIRNAAAGISQSPRKINPLIPRDLDTIVMKAISRSPDQRYQSGEALRRDLDCFLSNRPVSARRIGPFRRLARWSKREPVIASLTSLTFLSVISLAIVSAAGYLNVTEALKKISESDQNAKTALVARTDALRLAEHQRMRAERNLNVATNAFEQIMDDVTRRGIDPDAEILGEVTESATVGVTPADAELLKALLGFYDELSASNETRVTADDSAKRAAVASTINDHQKLRVESAVALRRVGDIYQRLGELEKADNAYAGAADRYARLRQTDPDDLNLVIAESQIQNERLIVAGSRGRLIEAISRFDDAVSLIRSSSQSAASVEGRFELARSNILMASTSARAGLDLAPSIPNQRRNQLPPRLARFLGNKNAGSRSQREQELIESAIESLQSLVAENPDDPRMRVTLGRAYRDQARIASNSRARSDRPISSSIKIFEDLLSELPNSDSFKFELAKSLSASETVGFFQLLRTTRANDLVDSLLEKSPELPRYLALKADVIEQLANHHLRAGRTDRAAQLRITQIKLFESLIAAMPSYIPYRIRLAQSFDAMADIDQRQKNTKAAADNLRRAIEILKPLGSGPGSPRGARQVLTRVTQKLQRIGNR